VPVVTWLYSGLRCRVSSLGWKFKGLMFTVSG